MAGHSEKAVDHNTIYVTPQWVISVIRGEQPQSGDYIILEASWGEPGKVYLDAHIPGAVHMNTDDLEESAFWNIRALGEIAAVMGRYGITVNTTVIVYGVGAAAARVAFVCFWAGVAEVHILSAVF